MNLHGMNKELLNTLTLFCKRVAILNAMTEEIMTDAEGTNSFKGQKVSRDMLKIQQKLRKIEKETKTILQYINTPDLMM